MKKILGCLGIGLGTMILLAGGYFFYVSRGIKAHENRISEKLQSVRLAIDNGNRPDSAAVAALAADSEVRNTLYDELKVHEMQDLFPQKFRTEASYAESNLVYWLCHPNELQQPPDEIELMEVVPVDSGCSLGDVVYYLFRFRVNKPHWAAGYGWMAGVSGPYVKGETLERQITGATFSELDGYDTQTPAEHVAYYHKMAVANGLYTEIEEALHEK